MTQRAVAATQMLAAEHGVDNLRVSLGDVYAMEFPDKSLTSFTPIVLQSQRSDRGAREMRSLRGWFGCRTDADYAMTCIRRVRADSLARALSPSDNK
jgi:hypothetical protein